MNRERLKEIILEEVGREMDKSPGQDAWSQSQIYQHSLKTKSPVVYITNLENNLHFKIQFANQNGNLFAAITQMTMKPASEPKLVRDPSALMGMENAGRFSIDYPK